MSSEDDLKKMLGEPKAAIRSMIIPFLIAMSVVEINQFIDTFWVSGLGTQSASAVSTIVPIYGLMMCAGLGIAAGITSFLTGIVAIKVFLKVLKNNKIQIFSIYAFVMSIASFLILYL